LVRQGRRDKKMLFGKRVVVNRQESHRPNNFFSGKLKHFAQNHISILYLSHINLISVIETKDSKTGRIFLLPKIEDMHRLPAIELKPRFSALKIFTTNKNLNIIHKNADFKLRKSSIKSNLGNDFLSK
jgi:hypothetical protein